MTTFLMNPYTGSVDTKEQWLSDMPTCDVYTPEGDTFATPEQEHLERQRQYECLIEVTKIDGSWVEV